LISWSHLQLTRSCDWKLLILAGDQKFKSLHITTFDLMNNTKFCWPHDQNYFWSPVLISRNSTTWPWVDCECLPILKILSYLTKKYCIPSKMIIYWILKFCTLRIFSSKNCPPIGFAYKNCRTLKKLGTA